MHCMLNLNEMRIIKMNSKIKEYAKTKNVFLWEIADRLGLQDSNFSRLLRHPLPEDKAKEIINIIDRIAEEKAVVL